MRIPSPRPARVTKQTCRGVSALTMRAGLWGGVCARLCVTVSFSLPEAGESLASEFLFSDVCRVGAGENCSSPAPQEGRTP